jgi:hypothetical protein
VVSGTFKYEAPTVDYRPVSSSSIRESSKLNITRFLSVTCQAEYSEHTIQPTPCIFYFTPTLDCGVGAYHGGNKHMALGVFLCLNATILTLHSAVPSAYPFK